MAVFLPLGAAPLVAADIALEDRADESLELVARQAPGADRRSAEKELSAIADRIARVVGALVLLVACVNVGGLVLAMDVLRGE